MTDKMVTIFTNLWDSGLGVAILVMVIAWTLVEYLMPDVTAWYKRTLAVLLGVALVTLGHAAGVTPFGPDTQGYLRALFFGVLGGGLAPLFHQTLIAKLMPWAKKKRGL